MYKIIGADQKEYGPVTADQLRLWIAQGRANGQTLGQAAGQMEWKPLSAFPELNVQAGFAPPPPIAAMSPPLPSTADVTDRLKGPGIALLIVGILVIIASFGDVAVNFSGNLPRVANQTIQRLIEGMHGRGALAWSVLHVAIGVIITIAGVRMQQARSHGLVMTAAILAMIPCTSGGCCLLGLPIGIWVLVIIMEPTVKAAFR